MTPPRQNSEALGRVNNARFVQRSGALDLLRVQGFKNWYARPVMLRGQALIERGFASDQNGVTEYWSAGASEYWSTEISAPSLHHSITPFPLLNAKT
jgi:hypothetical protein